MDELAQWLKAQLDEDERIARAAARQRGGGSWKAERDAREILEIIGEQPHPGHVDYPYIPVILSPDDDETTVHVAAWDPARVLLEIESDRELLAEYDRLVRAHEAHRRESSRLAESGDDDPIRRAALRREVDYLPAMLHVLERWAKRKAAVYVARPGFREEWRP
ncbi:DUF6221 family protein [Streptomyces antibioticus]|uniref:DUF6221 family protein n=1 Tax=Streptomyces antibioticus TaxID=1890 RepID=UPI0036A15781